MGKNRGKGKQKDNPVFKVAGAKVSKNKQKTAKVNTSLKRINIQAKSKTDAVNAKFSEIQDTLLYKKKGEKSTKSAPKNTSSTKPMDDTPPPDMADAVEQFSKL